jgi:hypothetical protein
MATPTRNRDLVAFAVPTLTEVGYITGRISHGCERIVSLAPSPDDCASVDAPDLSGSIAGLCEEMSLAFEQLARDAESLADVARTVDEPHLRAV